MAEFRDVKFLGNTRIDPCSRVLKREIMRKWVDANCDPKTTTIYLGIDWSEQHRAARYERYWHPYSVECPLTERPFLTKADMLEQARAEGLPSQRLYELGFAHANCGGGCVKAGQAQFELLLRTMPDRYAWWEQNEREIRAELGKDITILRDRYVRHGAEVVKPITLEAFRRVKLEPPIVRAAQRGEVSQVRLPLQAREPYYRQNTRLRSGQSSTLVKPFAPQEGDRLAVRHKRGPAACHVIVTGVARSDVNEITYQDARAMGYRTTADAMAGWVRLHGTPPEEGRCECCGGPGVRDGFCVTCGCDDQSSAAFHARHSHKPVWILTVELDRSHTPRLLACEPVGGSDYVTSPDARSRRMSPASASRSAPRTSSPARASRAGLPVRRPVRLTGNGSHWRSASGWCGWRLVRRGSTRIGWSSRCCSG
jgi:hypothetical protein